MFAVLVQAVEANASDERQVLRIIGQLSPQSPTVRNAYQKWLTVNTRNLRLAAIRGLTMTGSTEALLALQREASAGPRSEIVDGALSKLFAFRSSDPAAVQALGEIATSAASLAVRESAAYALRDIHTNRALPYFYRLLGDSDQGLRELAVSGFTAFVVQMRTPKDSLDVPAALNEVMNPGRRRKLPSLEAPFDTEETRSFAHFGPFPDKVREEQLLAFWKGWYARNQTAANAR